MMPRCQTLRRFNQIKHTDIWVASGLMLSIIFQPFVVTHHFKVGGWTDRFLIKCAVVGIRFVFIPESERVSSDRIKRQRRHIQKRCTAATLSVGFAGVRGITL